MKRLLKAALASGVKRWSGSAPTPLPPSVWGLQVNADGHLCLQGLDFAELTAKWGSPLFVVDGEALRRNVGAFLQRDDHGIQCEVYYSYKTNPVPAVLRLMHSLGVGAEVISEYELWLALRLGVQPRDIIYNGPVKSDASVRQAICRDIGLLNINHREEIQRIGDIGRQLGKRPSVGVRVCTSRSWGGQFGAPIATGEALAALREAMQHPNLNVRALHVHSGAPIRGETELRQMIEEVLAFAGTASLECGFQLDILDVGGSLGIPTVRPIGGTEKRLNMTLLADLAPADPSHTLAISSYVQTIRRVVGERFSGSGAKPPRVLLEPGRAMTGNTQFLATTVHSIKAGAAMAPYAILDAGINLAQTAQHELHQVFPSTRMQSTTRRMYRLAGPICSPGDVLYWACPLPELVAGDQLVIADAGAYFVPSSTSFSFPRPPIVLVDDGTPRLIRRSETFEDLVALDQVIEP